MVAPRRATGPALRVALALGLTVAAGTVPAAMALAPKAGRPIAVVGISDLEGDRIAAIGRAGGAILAGVGSRVTVAVAEDRAFLGRMRSLGYFIMLDAQAVGCVSEDRQRRQG